MSEPGKSAYPQPVTYQPPECPAGHGPMSLLPDGPYRRLHVCTTDGCGRSAFSDEAPPRPAENDPYQPGAS